MITVTKKFRFCYGHFLPGYDGKCGRVHGHNSEVEVEFKRPSEWNPYQGMVLDFSDIKEYVGRIIDYLDHRNLNDEFNFPPTAENIVNWLMEEIMATRIGSGLVRIRLTETPDSWAEWRKGT